MENRFISSVEKYFEKRSKEKSKREARGIDLKKKKKKR